MGHQPLRRHLRFSLSIAGHETTTNLLSNAVKHLLTHGDQWEQICADPALIENAVEEILRFDGPLNVWRRVATEEVELSGVKIPQGAKLALVLGSGSHDESYFAHPEQLAFTDRTRMHTWLSARASTIASARRSHA